MLRALDSAFIKAAAEQARKAGATTPVESRPVTPVLFDALFSAGH
jgi:hypothetical protein